MKIGFVGVRFAGLDGVSLEAKKVAEVIRGAGHEVSWFAGELSPDFKPGVEFPPARFDSAENQALQNECFGVEHTAAATFDVIEERAQTLEAGLRSFITDHDIDVLLAQQALAIPMQLPLGVALARIAGAGMPTVAHHHDFVWERERFYPNGVDSLLAAAFPPVAPEVRHVVINSIAQDELARRTGAQAVVVPNVMDFENPPDPGDGAAFRSYAGVDAGDIVLLQATRIIPRKSIELTLELAARLDDRSVKVIATHPDLDEGAEYAEFLVRLAGDLGVDYRMASVGDPGQPSLADAYAAADLVTYPSRIEGFGNALLEAIYFGCAVLVNRYPVYVADIAPTGLNLIEIDGAITRETVAQVKYWLGNTGLRRSAAASNYEICREHFSYAAVRHLFMPLFDE